jgi:hypothetical protein
MQMMFSFQVMDPAAGVMLKSVSPADLTARWTDRVPAFEEVLPPAQQNRRLRAAKSHC